MFSFKKTNLEKIKSFILKLDSPVEKEDREKFIKLIKPTIGIKTVALTDDKIKIGESKIGGRPDMPIGYKWSRTDNKPKIFCAQYNLSELSRLDTEDILPKTGMFYIFLTVDETYSEFDFLKDNFEFIYIDSVKNLTRIEYPEDLEEERKIKSARIKYFEYYTYPDDENYMLFELDKKYDNFHFYFYAPLEEYLEEEIYDDSDNLHQILGHDRSIQSSVVYDFASKELGVYSSEEYRSKWGKIIELSKSFKLLLQLDCFDSNTNLSRFGGSGTFYFGIKTEDLEKHDFTNIKASFQMT